MIEKADDDDSNLLILSLKSFMKYVLYTESSNCRSLSNQETRYTDKFRAFLRQRKKTSLKKLMVLLSRLDNMDRSKLVEDLELLFRSNKHIQGDYWEEIKE
jgi:hypothetical protein